MTKNMHFFGKRMENGKMGRFFGGHDDEEFEEIMKKLEGRLPNGFTVWHISNEEMKMGSKRIDQMKDYPLIIRSSFLGEHYTDDLDALLDAKENDEADAKDGLYLYDRQEIVEQVDAILAKSVQSEAWRTFERNILATVSRTDERLKLPVEDTHYRLLHQIINEHKVRLEKEWQSMEQAN